MGKFEFSKVSGSLHEGEVFNNLEDSPWHKDAIYPRFSEREYERRRQATREAMKTRGVDCIIAGGSSNLMSMWGAVVWLSGHMDHRSVANYVVFPAEGEATLLYPMSGPTSGPCASRRRGSRMSARCGTWVATERERRRESRSSAWRPVRSASPRSTWRAGGRSICPSIIFRICRRPSPRRSSFFSRIFSTSSDISKATKSSTATARRASWPTGRWGPWSSGPSRA